MSDVFVTVPETQQDVAEEVLEHASHTMKTVKATSADTLTLMRSAKHITYALDVGCIPFTIALGIRKDMTTIVRRENSGHCLLLGIMSCDVVAVIIAFLDYDRDARLRANMLENDLSLAVRQHHLHHMRGTPFWNEVHARDYALVNAFYNHHGNCSKMNFTVPIASSTVVCSRILCTFHNETQPFYPSTQSTQEQSCTTVHVRC